MGLVYLPTTILRSPLPSVALQRLLSDAVTEDSQLPVDPQEQAYRGKCTCGSSNIEPDRNIMDTWATSSVTPQINYRWGENDSREGHLAPMSMRPQAHDIIRTWAFYTMVKKLITTRMIFHGKIL